MDQKGHHLDLSSEAPAQNPSSQEGAKPFLGVHFTCCDVYARVYPNRASTVYIGHCPKCAKRVQFQIGSDGTDARFFTAG